MRTDDFEDRYYEVIVSPKMFVLKVASKCDFEDKIDKLDKFCKILQIFSKKFKNIGYMMPTLGG